MREAGRVLDRPAGHGRRDERTSMYIGIGTLIIIVILLIILL